MPDVLIFGDSIRSPELRHEVPVPVPDAFLYAEKDGRRIAVLHSLEIPRVRQNVPDLEIVPLEQLGSDELYSQGLQGHEIMLELAVRACREFGIERATVPETFPIGHADHLRANGIELRGRPRPLRQSPSLEERDRAEGDPQRAEGLRGGARRVARAPAARPAERRGPRSRRRAAHLRTAEARDRGRLRRPRGRGQRHDRRPRRADGGRPRHGLRPDRPERADRLRPLPAGQGDRLLRGHDPHLRRRRALGRGEGVVPPRQGGARELHRRRQAGRERPQALRGGLRHLPRRGLQDPAPQGTGRSARGRLLPRARARRRPRGARAAVPGPRSATTSSPATSSRWSRACTAPATAACASKTSSS